MEKFRFLKKDKIKKLPKKTGVYAFKNGRKFLYIGKAIDIKKRVKNHLRRSSYRDNLFMDKVEKIGYIKTGSEITALLLEAELIKKYKPKYNIMWRDDKNFFFVGITKSKLPRVFITHQTPAQKSKDKEDAKYIGPFVDGKAIKKTLRTLRKVFPYYTAKKHSSKPCPWCHLGLCPGPNPNPKEYKKDIQGLIAVLKGKRKSVLKKFSKEMNSASRSQNYERAARIRDQIRALEKIISNARIIREKRFKKPNWLQQEKYFQRLLKTKKKISRIEAYDVSNIQGKEATGSMVTFVEGKPDKNLYRKFKIKEIKKPDDTAMIREVLNRRWEHPEWGLPNLILIDGGKAQLNTAIRSKDRENKIKSIKAVSLAKKDNRLYIEGQKKALLLSNLPEEISAVLLRLRDEAHRFAIGYHRKLRQKDLLN